MFEQRQQLFGVDATHLELCVFVCFGFLLNLLPALAVKELVFWQSNHRFCIVRWRDTPAILHPISRYTDISDISVYAAYQIEARYTSFPSL